MSSREVSVDLGEDRVIMTAARHGIRSDFYLPFNVDQAKSEAIFDPVSEVSSLKFIKFRNKI